VNQRLIPKSLFEAEIHDRMAADGWQDQPVPNDQIASWLPKVMAYIDWLREGKPNVPR
jgi:hypothetical protein